MPSTLAQSKERKGSNFAIWQPCDQSPVLGGTWVYTDEVGKDSRHGLPIHSSMYKNLRTNLPKEVMAFPDFPFDDAECGKRSFIGEREVCNAR